MQTRYRNSLISMLFLISAASGSLAAAEGAWKLEKQEDGIDVYTRPVAGSGIKEFKAIGAVDAGVGKILEFLQDADGYKDWFPNCTDSKSLPPSDGASYRYSVSGTPWPISDRDMILQVVTSRDKNSGVVVMNVSAAPNAYPLQKGLVRVHKANGSWRLEPIGTSRTRVTFTMHLEPGGGIPEWLINARVVGTPLATLTNLRTSIGPSKSD